MARFSLHLGADRTRTSTTCQNHPRPFDPTKPITDGPKADAYRPDTARRRLGGRGWGGRRALFGLGWQRRQEAGVVVGFGEEGRAADLEAQGGHRARIELRVVGVVARAEAGVVDEHG